METQAQAVSSAACPTAVPKEDRTFSAPAVPELYSRAFLRKQHFIASRGTFRGTLPK